MSIERARPRLDRIARVVRTDEPLSRHTTFRIGGPARLYLECDSTAELSHAIEVLRDEETPWTVLGKGSNVLAADEGYEGAVVVLGPGFRRMSTDDETICAGAGCVLGHVVQEAFRRGLSGFEFAVGIPGTLGGALAMNAGSRDEWIGSVVSSLTLLVPDRGLVAVRGDEVDWGYRSTELPPAAVIVEATLSLASGDPDRVRAAMERRLRDRRRTQPLAVPNAGSVFVNPDGDSAGRLIEAAGLKGARCGGAAVSDVHANFIVNTGGATARDVMTLIERVRRGVQAHSGIVLRPEIRMLGHVSADPNAGSLGGER